MPTWPWSNRKKELLLELSPPHERAKGFKEIVGGSLVRKLPSYPTIMATPSSWPPQNHLNHHLDHHVNHIVIITIITIIIIK